MMEEKVAVPHESDPLRGQLGHGDADKIVFESKRQAGVEIRPAESATPVEETEAEKARKKSTRICLMEEKRREDEEKKAQEEAEKERKAEEKRIARQRRKQEREQQQSVEDQYGCILQLR
jgi:hypothetical protein